MKLLRLEAEHGEGSSLGDTQLSWENFPTAVTFVFLQKVIEKL